MSTSTTRPVTVAVTGASGALYGLRLVDRLLAADTPVYLMISEAGRLVLKMEHDITLPGRSAEVRETLCRRFDSDPALLRVFGPREWTSAVASGSGAPKRMVVCPCTTGTLSAIATGTSDTLIDRAADVVLKERGQLILVPREMPFSEIHLENMLRLSRMGAVIMPASPGFYHRPTDIDGLVDFVVARVLDHLGVEHRLMQRWGE
jgi:4-hydroxy-3-polyprenylbenzoate decarboxylase